MAAIRLHLLGGFQAGTPDGLIIPISSKKGRALLAYLAMQARPQTREKLSGLLWSSREQAQAQNSLRHELVELRRAFGAFDPPPLTIEGDTLGLAAGAVETDVSELERSLADDRIETLQAAARLCRGVFLDGLTIRDSVFEDWLAQERDRLQELTITLFDRLAARLNGPAAINAAQALIALNPLRESSHRALMRANALHGDTELAMRQYQTCRQLLRDELDVAPDAETERLYRAIRAGEMGLDESTDPGLAQGRPAAADAGKPLLAVLPFDIVGQDPDLEIIGTGLIEEISTGIARFRLVDVVSRHVVLAYREHAAEVPLLRATGARYVLTGSLRRSRERMRAAVQLIETETDRELWSERYDRALADAFAIQDELTQAIIAAIEHVLVAAEHRRAIASGLGESEILKQKAGWHLFRFTRQDNARAIDLLRRAIAQNSDADRRYQALALALGVDLAFGWAATAEDAIVEMLGAAERSVLLREADAWNHAALCWSLMFVRRFEDAAASAQRMIELNPNSGVSYGVSSLVLAHCGDPNAALDLLDQSRRMAPQAPFMFNYLTGGAIAQCRLGRFAQAVEMAESASLRRPNYFQPHLILATALGRLGERDRAAKALAAARRLAQQISVAWLEPRIPLKHQADVALLAEGLNQNIATESALS